MTASAIGTAAFVSCDAVAGHGELLRPIVAGAAAVCAVLVLRWRFGRWLKAKRSASEFLRTVVMVGTNEDAEGSGPSSVRSRNWAIESVAWPETAPGCAMERPARLLSD